MIDVTSLDRCPGAPAAARPWPAAATGCAALLLAALLSAAQAAPAAQSRPAAHRCAAAASKQAQALLSFHAGAGTAIDIDQGVKVLAPLRNPANRSQQFDVLEVRGHVYRADYQMRLIYARIPGTCVLMGQEIIEQSSV